MHHDYAEYVSAGHPDRLSDNIANEIVIKAQNTAYTPTQRTLSAIEVAIHDASVFIDGRVAISNLEMFPINFSEIAHNVFKDAGYSEQWQPNNLEVITRVCENELTEAEADIRSYSDDQNIVHGYAIHRPQTNFLPTAHWLAYYIGKAITQFRNSKSGLFGPDFKVLVNISEQDNAIIWQRLLLSIQHVPGIGMEEQHRIILPVVSNILKQAEEAGLFGVFSTFKDSLLHLNGAGDFFIGGPQGDNGLSGKKLVIDHYGPTVPIGGGAMWGKDIWKVDRCGPLRARQLAKQLVTIENQEALVTVGWAPGDATPFLYLAQIRDNKLETWREVPTHLLPSPEWFAIETIVNDLELKSTNWRDIPVRGAFVEPGNKWE